MHVLLFLLACSGAEPTPDAPAPQPEPEPTAEPAPEAPASTAKANLNTATDDEFRAVMPDISKRMLHEFEEYRPYVSIQQFRKEMGKYVEADVVAGFEQHVYVPIAYNECDGPTLQQIPGLSDEAAAALTAGRPYDSEDAFLAKLGEHVDADAVQLAKTYLKP